MHRKKLGHLNQKLLVCGGKTMRSRSLDEKARLQNSIMSHDLLEFFFYFIGLYRHKTKSEIIKTKY